MLIKIIQDLQAYIATQHTTHDHRQVDYWLDGSFTTLKEKLETTRRDIPYHYLNLEFVGSISASVKIDDGFSVPGKAYAFSGGRNVISSVRDLASRLLMEDVTQRGIDSQYYNLEISDYGGIKIKIRGTHQQIEEELNVIDEACKMDIEESRKLPKLVAPHLLHS